MRGCPEFCPLLVLGELPQEPPSQHPSDSPRRSSEAVAAGAGGCLCEQWIRWVEQLCRKTILIGRTSTLPVYLTIKGLQKHQIATASLINARVGFPWSQFPVMVSNETEVGKYLLGQLSRGQRPFSLEGSLALRECGAEGKSCVPGHPARSRHGWTGGCALWPALLVLVTAFNPEAWS